MEANLLPRHHEDVTNGELFDVIMAVDRRVGRLEQRFERIIGGMSVVIIVVNIAVVLIASGHLNF
jgi:hypothetical protein